jgi:hypothetical protein
MPKQSPKKSLQKGAGSNVNSQATAVLKINIRKHEMIKDLITKFFQYYDWCIKTIDEDLPKTTTVNSVSTIQANVMMKKTDIMNDVENMIVFMQQHQIDQNEFTEINMIEQETHEWFDKVYSACESKKQEFSPPTSGGASKAAPKKKKTPVAKKPSKKSK